MVNEFRSLLDEGYFVQMRVAESREEGRAEGREEGLTEGLQEALLTATELRFPALSDLAHERVRQARRSENLSTGDHKSVPRFVALSQRELDILLGTNLRWAVLSGAFAKCVALSP